MQEKFLKSVTARLTVAQVVSSVKAGAELTFDFVCYTVLAAWIAAMGLLDNSVVNTVASMLVSPLMGPVMAMTFGTIIRDKSLRNMGIRNAFIGFGITILFGYCPEHFIFSSNSSLLFAALGYIFGLIVLNFTNEWNPDALWPTDEMKSRGQLRVLWIGALVAIPSGAAVAVSILSGNQASLVGVAISASLLPPCVNTGLLWSFATLKALKSVDELFVFSVYNGAPIKGVNPALVPQEGYKVTYSENMALECVLLGIVSFLLAAVNEVAPLSSMSSPTSRFWREDVKVVISYLAKAQLYASFKIARERNRSGSSVDKEQMRREILEEWARIAGVDPNELLSNKPESRAAQEQTFRDLIEDAIDDDVFRSIVRSTHAAEAS
ncbi:DUF389 domain containing protein-like protein [Dinothrombium tinctorium]|uniref:DUF389 domain containing protein-like protein n=1 Tax=Dinothrombium tinctorium TaxID=1965070 RepID=A0A3S3P8C6_9ACAR|nr:DUF389 domain containing protein-like protein [Dinothrombium tinctorium]